MQTVLFFKCPYPPQKQQYCLQRCDEACCDLPSFVTSLNHLLNVLRGNLRGYWRALSWVVLQKSFLYIMCKRVSVYFETRSMERNHL